LWVVLETYSKINLVKLNSFRNLQYKFTVMKVKVSNITEKSLKELRKTQLKKLAIYKTKGYTKEQLYPKFTKVFIDKNY
jgi:hypothetical protein